MASEPEYLGAADEEERSVELAEVTPNALAVINQSEHAAMVATANMKGNQRNLDVFSKRLMQYATHSQMVALGMFYTLPRAGKQIVGPSVRFAEIVAPCWRNNSTGSRIVGVTDETVTAQGVFIDYEANMRNVKEVPRRITSSDGRKYNADMILTTSKAALSVAYRDAILKGGVPQALWNPSYDEAKNTAVGKAVSHSERVALAMEYLNKLKVTEWQIMNAVGVSSPAELEIDHLLTLKVMCEEIKRGERTIEEVFGSPWDKEIEALFTQLKKNQAERTMLRNSYMGRAEELVKYLRDRVAPAGQGTTVSTEEHVSQAAEQGEKGNGGKKGKKKDKPADEKPEPETKTETAEEKPEPQGEQEAESGKFAF